MKQRSITGPVLLVIVGVVFLINNIWHDIPLWSLVSDFWPEALIVLGVIGLFEALYHFSRGVPTPPRGISGGGIVWLVMLAGFMSWAHDKGRLQIGPFAGDISVFGNDYNYDVSATGESQGVKRVIVDGIRGMVSVRGGEGDVKLSGRKTVRAASRGVADKVNEQTPYRIEREGDQLFVRIADPKDSDHVSISGELDLVAPKGLEVEIRGSNGDLTIDGMDGKVEVAAGRGDVRVTNIGNDVKVESNRSGLIRVTDVKGNVELAGPKGSDVEIENIAGETSVQGEYGGTMEFRNLAKSLHFVSKASDLRLEGVPGSIKLDGGDLTMTNVAGPVRFRGTRKDVDITDLTGGLSLSVEHGDVQVTQTKAPLPKMEVHSGNGEITLSLPEKAGFDLTAHTTRGEATNDFGDALRTEVSGRMGTISGRQGSGPEIKADTDRGAVTVKKN